MDIGFNTDGLCLAKGALRQARVCIGHLRSPGRSSTQPAPHYDRVSAHFRANVSDDACWEWTGGCSSLGVPKLTAESTTTSIRIRRYIWLSFIGQLRGGIHPGLQSKDFETVSSSCGNRTCVRPSHLIKRAAYRGRQGRLSYQGIGPRKNQKALSPVSVMRLVRAESVIRLKRQGLTNSKVASALKMSLSQVERVISGTSFPFLCRDGLRKSIALSSRLNRISSLTKYKTSEARRSAKAKHDRQYRMKIKQMVGSLCKNRLLQVSNAAIFG